MRLRQELGQRNIKYHDKAVSRATNALLGRLDLNDGPTAGAQDHDQLVWKKYTGPVPQYSEVRLLSVDSELRVLKEGIRLACHGMH